MNRGGQSMGIRGLLGNAPQQFQGNMSNNMQGMNQMGNMQANMQNNMGGGMQGNLMGNLQQGSSLLGNIGNNMGNMTNDMNINNMMAMNQRNQQMGLLGHVPQNQQGNAMQNMANMQQQQQQQQQQARIGNVGSGNFNQGMVSDEMRQAMMMKNMMNIPQNSVQFSQNQQQQSMGGMNMSMASGNNNMMSNMAGNQGSGLLNNPLTSMTPGGMQTQLNSSELQLKQQQQLGIGVSNSDSRTVTQSGGLLGNPMMSGQGMQSQDIGRTAGGRSLLPTPGNVQQQQQQQLNLGNNSNFEVPSLLGRQDGNQGLVGRQDSNQGLIARQDNNQGLLNRQDNAHGLIGRQDNQGLIGRLDNQSLSSRQDNRKDFRDRFDDRRSQNSNYGFDRRQNDDRLFDNRDDNRRVVSNWDSNDDRRSQQTQDYGRYSSLHQDLKRDSPEKEQYDPEEPTEDDILSHNKQGALEDFNNLRTASPINGQKRSLPMHYDDIQQSKMRREMVGDSDHDIMQNGTNEKFHCQLCNVSCLSVQEFDQHMHSEVHQQRMASITSLYQARTEQQIQRMKAEEVLRRVEQASDEKCEICLKKMLRESLQEHIHGQEHIRKERLTKRGCILCKTGRFDNYPNYVAHIDSDAHKQAKEVLNKELAEKKKPTDSSSSSSTTSSSNHTGNKSSEERASSRGKESAPRSNGHQSVVKTEVVQQPDAQEVDMDIIQVDLSYDPDTPVGQSFVIPVKGFFCKLCHKFYNNEDMAKNAHCKSERHFEKYQEYVVSQQQENDVPRSQKVNRSSTTKNPELTIKISNDHNESSEVQFQDNIDSKDTMEVEVNKPAGGSGDAPSRYRGNESKARNNSRRKLSK